MITIDMKRIGNINFDVCQKHASNMYKLIAAQRWVKAILIMIYNQIVLII